MVVGGTNNCNLGRSWHAHQELKGMGGNNKPYGGRMEIRVNGTIDKGTMNVFF